MPNRQVAAEGSCQHEAAVGYLAPLASVNYVLLTTFKPDGLSVSTPVSTGVAISLPGTPNRMAWSTEVACACAGPRLWRTSSPQAVSTRRGVSWLVTGHDRVPLGWPPERLGEGPAGLVRAGCPLLAASRLHAASDRGPQSAASRSRPGLR